MLIREVAKCKAYIARTKENRERLKTAAEKINPKRVLFKHRFKRLKDRFSEEDRKQRRTKDIDGNISVMEEILEMINKICGKESRERRINERAKEKDRLKEVIWDRVQGVSRYINSDDVSDNVTVVKVR